MNLSKARELLRKAEGEKKSLRRNLLLAAAISQAVSRAPIVVGGTAEEFWGGHEYHETDLDLVGHLTEADRGRLHEIGLRRRGRYWFRPDSPLIVEFPDTHLDGDELRVENKRVGGVATRVIGLDDLYIDRLKQATMNAPAEDIHFQSALAVAASRFEDIDWSYVSARIASTRKTEPLVGKLMVRVNSKIRARVRRALSARKSGRR